MFTRNFRNFFVGLRKDNFTVFMRAIDTNNKIIA